MPAPFGDLGAGATLGRYELLLPVARGGMAQVWAARVIGSAGLPSLVAVKTMLPAFSTDEHFEQMFLAEAEIAARIQHPNVGAVLDRGEQDGVLYLVMEWIDGESLLALSQECEARGRAMPLEVAAQLVRDAARGLHAAHELRDESGALAFVVHRDVSPHNILVTPAGAVKIVDFGVAKAVARSEHPPTSAGHRKGKAQYMAPEQIYGDAIDRRVDVFALGIVLYHLTTGTHPFRGANVLATLARITAPEPAAAPGTLVPGYPDELARVVARALAKDREARYPTMAALADDLDAALRALGAAGATVTAADFVGEMLGARAAVRAADLREAERAADLRAAERAADLRAAERAADLRAAERAVDERRGCSAAAPTFDPLAAAESPAAARATERRASRGLAVAAAVAGVGLAAGAAIVVRSGGGVPPAAMGPGSAVMAARVQAPTVAAPAKAPSAASAAPSASASASALPAAHPPLRTPGF
jgi:serine/threonine-protein kinase